MFLFLTSSLVSTVERLKLVHALRSDGLRVETGGARALETLLARPLLAMCVLRIASILVLLMRRLALTVAISLLSFAAWCQLLVRLLHACVMDGLPLLRLSHPFPSKAAHLLLLILLSFLLFCCHLDEIVGTAGLRWF